MFLFVVPTGAVPANWFGLKNCGAASGAAASIAVVGGSAAAADMEMGPFPMLWSAAASSCWGGIDIGVIMGPGGGIIGGAAAAAAVEASEGLDHVQLYESSPQ